MNLSLLRPLILLALAVNAAAMFSPVINGGDSVTYAALSQHIAQSGDWADLVLDGQDWLDKPHLPFWLTAVSFKLFGVGSFAYILPGFLFHLVGGYFTWRIARLFYAREAALMSALVYVSVFHLMDSSIEVKAETYLTGFIMGACYYWLRYDAEAKLKYLLLGTLFSACAVMTKGIFTLITIGSGLVFMWLYHRQWWRLFSPRWLLALGLSLLFTAPEVAALYLQFDAHPEKVVFGQTHVSGVKFFLWDSQFGRFFNTGPIKNTNGHPLYFVLVFLWAFLPWVPVFLAALYDSARRFASDSDAGRSGFVFLCGAFFVTFGLFSATSFQLDHYTVILFPFAAILSGKLLADRLARTGPVLPRIQAGLGGLLLVLATALALYSRQPLVIAFEGGLLVALLLAMRSWDGRDAKRLVIVPLFGILAVYGFLALANALTFTAHGAAYNAGRALAGHDDAPVYVYRMDIVSRELGLYHPAPCLAADRPERLPASGKYYLMATAEEAARLGTRLPPHREVARGDWVVHKTGTFPRFLRLVRGEEPLDKVLILEVGAAPL